MHNHHHDHSNERIGWAFFLNVCFTVIEFIGGLLTNSTAILADAVHDLGDSLSIGLAWLLNRISSKPANSKFSYGYQRFGLMGALINSLVLIAGSVWVMSEAIPKLFEPEMPNVEGMILLAILGVTVNGIAAYKLSKGSTLNERVLNWHLIEDVLGWVAVLIVSIVLWFYPWPILDPLLSIAFTIFILVNVVRTLRETVTIFLQAVPDKTLSGELYQQLGSVEGVEGVHHLHLWSLDGEHHVMTAHLLISNETNSNQQVLLKKQLAEKLSSFNLAHTTIEFEFTDEGCRDGE